MESAVHVCFKYPFFFFFLNLHSHRCILVLSAPHLKDCNCRAAGIRWVTILSIYPEYHSQATSIPKTVFISFVCISKMFNCLTNPYWVLILWHTLFSSQKKNSELHLTFPNSYPNLHMYFISNFITSIHVTCLLLGWSFSTFSLLLWFLTLQHHSPCPYLFILHFSSSSNTQLKFSLYSQVTYVPVEVILMRILALFTAFLYCSFWCIIIE